MKEAHDATMTREEQVEKLAVSLNLNVNEAVNYVRLIDPREVQKLRKMRVIAQLDCS